MLTGIALRSGCWAGAVFLGPFWLEGGVEEGT